MRKPEGYDTANATLAGEYERLEAGGYVCRIVNATEQYSRNGRDMLVLSLDIAEGENTGIFARQYKADTRPEKKWPVNATFYQLKDGMAIDNFKGVIKAIQDSNNGFTFDWQEESLKGKFIGVVFGAEEYLNRDNNMAVSVKPKYIKTVASIKNGDYKVPPLKTLPANESQGRSGFDAISEDINDECLPF
jgi:hypothetical protein